VPVAYEASAFGGIVTTISLITRIAGSCSSDVMDFQFLFVTNIQYHYLTYFMLKLS
jgi:hypothetical protein